MFCFDLSLSVLWLLMLVCLWLWWMNCVLVYFGKVVVMLNDLATITCDLSELCIVLRFVLGACRQQERLCCIVTKQVGSLGVSFLCLSASCLLVIFHLSVSIRAFLIEK